MNFRQWRDAVIAARDGLTFGPWRPEGWYPGRPDRLPSWRHWRPFTGITMTITESMTRTVLSERGPDYGSGDRTSYETIYASTYEFTATVTAADIWRGAPLFRPEGKSMWHHQSATAFGQGLYDCLGTIIVCGTARTTGSRTDITTEPGESPDTSITGEYDTTVDATRELSYESDLSALAGLGTFARMVADQSLHPPSLSTFFPYPAEEALAFPPELDPDGLPLGEVYWTDEALRELHSGSWSTDMVLTTGFLSGLHGPNMDDTDNGDRWEDSFSRTGNLTLTFT